MHWVAEIVIGSVKESVIFTSFGAGAAIGGVLLLGSPFTDGFGLILLLEATALMLIGGALDLSATRSARTVANQIRNLFGRAEHSDSTLTRESYKKVENSAATYALTGVLLFVESLLLAFLLT
jgi:hypothetical protein